MDRLPRWGRTLGQDRKDGCIHKSYSDCEEDTRQHCIYHTCSHHSAADCQTNNHE